MIKVFFLATLLLFSSCAGAGAGSDTPTLGDSAGSGAVCDNKSGPNEEDERFVGPPEKIDISKLTCEELSELNITIPTVHTIRQWHEFHDENGCLSPGSYEGWITGVHYFRTCNQAFMDAEREVIETAYFDVCERG